MADAGMHLQVLEESPFQGLETAGFRRGIIDKASCLSLPEDVQTLDFSSFPVYVHTRPSP